MPQQTHGLEAILAALATGGQPVGNLGLQPQGVNPNPSGTPADLASTQGGEVQGQVPANPAREAQAENQGAEIEAILRALLEQGVFNRE